MISIAVITTLTKSNLGEERMYNGLNEDVGGVSLGKHSLGDLLTVSGVVHGHHLESDAPSVLCFMLVDKCKFSATTPVSCLPACLPPCSPKLWPWTHSLKPKTHSQLSCLGHGTSSQQQKSN